MELPKEDPSNGSSSRKGRSRSLSIRGSNPFDCPLTQSDLELSALRKQILSTQEKEAAIKNTLDAESAASPPQLRRRARSVSFIGTNPLQTPLTDTEYELSSYRKKLNQEREQEERVKQDSTTQVPQFTRRPLPPLPESPSPSRRLQLTSKDDIPEKVWEQTRDFFASDKREKNKSNAEKKSDAIQFLEDKKDAHRAKFEKFQSAKPTTKFEKRKQIVEKMNYQNYIDSPGGGPSANPRQAPPSPSQGMNHPNGMNGGGGMGMGGMVGYPTPAGHQSDLNYIMSMVEDLSAVLRQNQLLTASVVEKVGKVREKASTMNLTNDELIAAVASELNEDSKNLEKENSELRKALEKAEYDKKENWKLACHGANILADVTEKMHKFREQTDADIHAWHKNYRQQLLAEREENLALRNQINDMKAAACRANEHLRQMRRYVTDHDELHELRVQNVQFRQERRFWKRMAMPLIPDDDSEWSDDDDLIDPEEKKRQAALKDAEKERKEKEETEGGEGTSA